MESIRTSQISVLPDVINLAIGQPGFDLLPMDLIRRAAEQRLSQNDPILLNYGYEQGDGFFRLALAEFLQSRYGIPVEGEALFVSNGVSQALDLICTLYTQPGDVIFVEEPTYFLALRIFADHHLQPVSVPLDKHGLVVDALEPLLIKQKPKFIYTIPAFQNPAGVTLSAERRKKLVELSRAYEFLIVADEVYHLLNYTIDPPLPMAAYTRGGNVFSLGSFSKILAPGLRLGWVQAEPDLLSRLTSCGLLDSGGGLNPFTSNIVRVILEEGWLDTNLDQLQDIFKKRIRTMQAALIEHLEGDVIFNHPDGGYFFWLTLPNAIDAQRLLEVAKRHKVGFQPGANFSSRGELHNYLRLSFAFYGEPQLAEGVRRLRQVMDNYPG